MFTKDLSTLKLKKKKIAESLKSRSPEQVYLFWSTFIVVLTNSQIHKCIFFYEIIACNNPIAINHRIANYESTRETPVDFL